MVVWTGFGFLIAIIGFGALIGTEIVIENIAGNESFYQDDLWVIFFGMVVAAAITHFLNKTILLPKSKVVLDKETKEEILLRNEHSLFFIAAKWWPVIFIGIGVVFAIRSFTNS